MLFIADRSTVQANTIWKITNRDIIEGNSKLTYFSPGGYSIKDNQDRLICFDWCDSCADYNEDDKSLLEATQYSLDYDHINDSLIEESHNDLVKDEHRLELFKDFKEIIETYCTIDIDGKEVPYEDNIECIYFELYDPISEEKLILLDKEGMSNGK